MSFGSQVTPTCMFKHDEWRRYCMTTVAPDDNHMSQRYHIDLDTVEGKYCVYVKTGKFSDC